MYILNRLFLHLGLNSIPNNRFFGKSLICKHSNSFIFANIYYLNLDFNIHLLFGKKFSTLVFKFGKKTHTNIIMFLAKKSYISNMIQTLVSADIREN